MIDITCQPRKDSPANWGVEEIVHPPEGDGEIHVAIFIGPESELRAKAYAEILAAMRHIAADIRAA